jgi:hypothetical protein
VDGANLIILSLAHTVFQTADTCPIATYSTYQLMPIVEYMLLECPIRAPHPQMGRSDWTLLTTSVSLLASSDMYVATGQVQEYSAPVSGATPYPNPRVVPKFCGTAFLRNFVHLMRNFVNLIRNFLTTLPNPLLNGDPKYCKYVRG